MEYFISGVNTDETPNNNFQVYYSRLSHISQTFQGPYYTESLLHSLVVGILTNAW